MLTMEILARPLVRLLTFVSTEGVCVFFIIYLLFFVCQLTRVLSSVCYMD